MGNVKGVARSPAARGARIIGSAVLVAAASAHCNECNSSGFHVPSLGSGAPPPPSLAGCIAGAASGPPPDACVPFVRCLESNCGSNLTTCFGPEYDAGIVEGACASFESCATQIGCTPAAGVSCAEGTTAACQQCLDGLVQCADSSCAPAFAACALNLLSDLAEAGTIMTSADAATDSSFSAPDAGATDAAPISDADLDAVATRDAEADGVAPADANPDVVLPSLTPEAVTVDSAGYVFVATDDGVDVYSPYPALALLQSLGQSQVGLADAGTPLLSPDGIAALAIDGAGHLLVGNTYETAEPGGCFFTPPSAYGSDVVSYADESTATSPPSLGMGALLLGNPTPTKLGCLTGLGAKAGATIFLTTEDAASAFDLAGNPVATVSYPGYPNVEGIAADPSSNYVYASDYNQGAVYQLTLSGTTLTLTSTLSINGGSSEPTGITVDASGNVYVSDTLSGIDIFSNTGAQTGQIPSVVGKSLAMDATGHLYVDESGAGAVLVYTNVSGTWTKTAQITYFP